MASSPTIGFIGLGAMGFGMATHLVSQHYPVVGYDVYAPTLERFTAAGGTAATSLADAVRGKKYVIVMVASAVQAQDALFGKTGVVSDLEIGTTLILCSTVPASYAQSVQSQLTALTRTDIFFIDAPVSGGAARASNGTLSIMAGASDAALQKGRFLLSEMADAQKLYLVPGGVGSGSNMKMVHQVLAAIQILAASEAMGFAARLGLDAEYIRERIVGSDAWSWMHENRAPRMLAEDYFPGVSALTIILKDVGIITSSARDHGFPTPLCATAEQIYLTGVHLGYGANDDAGMVRLYFPKPITTVPSPSASEGSEEKTALVLSLLRNIHLCAAAEAIAFAKFLNVDMGQYVELVNAAAGGSAMFRLKAPEMISGSTQVNVNGSRGKTRTLDDAVAELSTVVQTARDLNCPLHLGNAVLNVMLGGKRRGFGGAPEEGVVRMWDD